MHIPKIRRTYRNLMRIKEILQLLTKHGFGHIVARLRLSIYLPRLKYLGMPKDIPPYLTEESVAVRLRVVLQELGPTFVKFGQILSGRPDIFPESFIHELRVLQDKVAPFPVDELLRIVKRELKISSFDDVFLQFDEHVLASGSIGQVHEAQLKDGTKVILKVKRPGINEVIATDMIILHFLASLIEKHIQELRIFQPVMIVEEFDRTVRRELDFTAEASYTEQFSLLLRNNEHVGSPKVFWKYTSQNIITLQKLSGANIGDIEKLRQQGINIKQLAQRLAATFTEQYFIWGFFHADPHQGNILVSPEGKINLVDFGMVGHMTEELKKQLATTLLALMHNDLEMIVEIYADLGALPDHVNRRELKTDILELLDKYLHIPFQHMDMASIFENIVRLARNHKVILPRDFVLLGKSIVTVTGIAKELDSDFNFMKAIAPNISKILKEKLSPKHLFHTAFFYGWAILSFLQKLPLDLKEILRLLKKGKLHFELQHDEFHNIILELTKVGNRLSSSLVLSSLIISSALLTLSHIGPKFQDIPILGLMGYILASIWILFLMITNYRS